MAARGLDSAGPWYVGGGRCASSCFLIRAASGVDDALESVDEAELDRSLSGPGFHMVTGVLGLGKFNRFVRRSSEASEDTVLVGLLIGAVLMIPVPVTVFGGGCLAAVAAFAAADRVVIVFGAAALVVAAFAAVLAGAVVVDLVVTTVLAVVTWVFFLMGDFGGLCRVRARPRAGGGDASLVPCRVACFSDSSSCWSVARSCSICDWISSRVGRGPSCGGRIAVLLSKLELRSHSGYRRSLARGSSYSPPWYWRMVRCASSRFPK